MISSPEFQECSARFGLKGALDKGMLDNVELAQQIAEARYRTLVGRDIYISEFSDIHLLIAELRAWVLENPLEKTSVDVSALKIIAK